MKMTLVLRIWLRARRAFAGFAADRRGIAATEFAVIVPIMLVMYFGTVELSSGIAVDRKVTLMARSLSDLTSQSLSVDANDMTNFFAAGAAIMTPYPADPIKATITELYIDPNTLQARVQWSQGSSPRGTGSPVTIPTALAIAGTYLIFSEVSYLYKPTIGYVMAKSGVTLSDTAYTRPRQSECVMFGTTSPPCPKS
jgi:Flp pilus assembly protein TadG